MQIKCHGIPISVELHILLESIRYTFNPDADLEVDLEILKNHDTVKLRKLVNYNRIKPMLLNFDRTYHILESELRIELEKAHQNQVQKNLKNIKVTQDILKLLSDHQIPCLPMKGSLFINTIYQNQQIREVNDIDILCQKQHVRHVIRLLQHKGYQLRLGSKYFPAEHEAGLLDLLLKDDHFNEISLSKQGVHIDLHWELCKPYNCIQFSAGQLFENTQIVDFYGQQITLPSNENLFWMMMIHHGGVERWSKLKFIADLWAFQREFGSIIDMDETMEKSHHFKINRAVLLGFSMLEFVSKDQIIGSKIEAEAEQFIQDDTKINQELQNLAATKSIDLKKQRVSKTNSLTQDILKQVINRWELAEVRTSDAAWSKHKMRLSGIDPTVSKINALRLYVRHYWTYHRFQRYPKSSGMLSLLNRIKNRLKS